METLPACVFLALFSVDKIFSPMSVCVLAFQGVQLYPGTGSTQGRREAADAGHRRLYTKDQYPQLCQLEQIWL